MATARMDALPQRPPLVLGGSRGWLRDDGLYSGLEPKLVAVVSAPSATREPRAGVK